MIDGRLRGRVAQVLGASIVDTHPLSGGDINDAYRIELDDGRALFLKTNSGADANMFGAEARGLRWLAEPAAVRVPEVIAVDAEFLVLEYLVPGAARPDFDERFGRGLAALHHAGPTEFGLDHDNFIGRLPQANAAQPDWPTFYRVGRLEPQLQMANEAGLADAALRRDFERLFGRLVQLVGPAEPPSRVHGDLWAGNLHRDPDGDPVLIDPAVYGGHREVDLAMMQLFGGFSDRCHAAYAEVWPLALGHRERVSLYQLYPLMVHLNLFGRRYLAAVRRALTQYL